MIVSGIVDVVDRDERPSDGRPTWRVMVIPDTPMTLPGEGVPVGTIAFRIARPAEPSATEWATPPLVHGDRVGVPMLRGDRLVTVTRADWTTGEVRMLGSVFDPAAGLA